MAEQLKSWERADLEKSLFRINGFQDMVLTEGWKELRIYLQAQYDLHMKIALDKRVTDPYKKTSALLVAGIYKEILDYPETIAARRDGVIEALDPIKK